MKIASCQAKIKDKTKVTRERKRLQEEQGITLVALIITIIVLVILAAVSIATVYNSKIVEYAINGAQDYTTQAVKENQIMRGTEGIIQSGIDRINQIVNQGEEVTVSITQNGSEVKITKSNLGEYLGKKVTNYTGQSSISVDGTTYTVSPTYRLYYVDFDNKYGDGEGTIYLKSECTSNNYALQLDTSSASTAGIKIDELNPSLYASGVTSPSSSNSNMQAVTWLTNTNKWTDLKDTTFGDKVNCVVGSPSLEMFMDSYNTHYASIVGNATEPVASGERNASSERTKLFYKYTTGDYGYKVGPGKTSAWNTYTDGNYTVQTDSAIDSMYYPGDSQYYWLASPSAGTSDRVMRVSCGYGGVAAYYTYNNSFALCPLVSLKSDVQLSLQ